MSPAHQQPAAPGKYTYLIDDDYIEKLTKVSPLHDIGKVGIPDCILLKPGRLTAKEFEVMKTHTTIGAKTLLEVKEKFPEKTGSWNWPSTSPISTMKGGTGPGTPGTEGERDPLSARIMAIVDVYDALRSKRVYKDAYTHEESLKIIKEESGKAFDPEIVAAFLEVEDEIREIFLQYENSGARMAEGQ